MIYGLPNFITSNFKEGDAIILGWKDEQVHHVDETNGFSGAKYVPKYIE